MPNDLNNKFTAEELQDDATEQREAENEMKAFIPVPFARLLLGS